MIPKIPRFILILILAGCVSCASHRQVTEQTNVSISESMAMSEDSVSKRIVYTDTTKTAHGKVIITEIEFDTTPDPPDVESETPRADNSRASPAPVVKVNPDGEISVSGGKVKNVRQTVIEDETEQKGVAVDESVNESHNERQEAKDTLSQMERKEDETPAKSETRSTAKWPWWVLAVIALAALLYLKRIPVLNFIRKILGALRRIL